MSLFLDREISLNCQFGLDFFIGKQLGCYHHVEAKKIMSIPLLHYDLSSQNQRVNSFEIAWEEQPRIYNTDDSCRRLGGIGKNNLPH
jgi:hypothetical protein